MDERAPDVGALEGVRHKRAPRQRWVRLLIGALSLGLFGAVLYVGGLDAWRQLLAADGRWVGVAFGCTAGLTAVTAARWGLLANALAGTRLCSTRAYYHYLMMGRTAGLVLPEAVAVHTVGPLAMKAGGHASFGLAFASLAINRSQLCSRIGVQERPPSEVLYDPLRPLA